MASISEYKSLSLDDLVIDTSQVRTRHVAKDLDELVGSISKVGVLEPIVVCPTEEEEKYSIITGQRRFLACRKLQLEEIPAVILDDRLSEIEAKVLSVTENLVRKDLASLDLIDVCTYLYKQYGTINAVVTETGLPYDKVRQYVKYDRLVEPLKAVVDSGEIDINVALRAQDAASSGDTTDSDDALILAREMSNMSGAQRDKIVKDMNSDPALTAEDAIEDAKSGGKITQIVVTLSSEVHVALGKYADSQGTNRDEAASNLIRQGLYMEDLLGEADI